MSVQRIQLLGNSRSDAEMAGTKRYKITRNDATGNPIELTSFATRDEQVEAMMVLDEHGRCAYDHDPVYRQTVKDLSENSTFSEPTLARRNPIPTDADFLEGLRRDAIMERRNQLVELAGGNNAQAKYDLALAMTNGEFYDSAMEMQAATEQSRPFEDYLKARKEAGEGPLQWTYAVDADKAIPGYGETTIAKADSDGHIIEVEP